MIIYIVRHPETEYNKKGIIQGHADSSLTYQGKKIADKLGKLLKNKDIGNIYSSDLGRCMQTSKIIQKQLKQKIIPTIELRELDYGNFNGEKAEIIRQKFDLSDPNIIFHNGESFNQMKQRVLNFIQQLREIKPVLVVTHDGCLRAIISEMLKVKFTSSKCKTKPDQMFRLDTVNRRIVNINS